MLDFPYTLNGFTDAVRWIHKRAAKDECQPLIRCLDIYRNLCQDLPNASADNHKIAMINVIDIANKARKDYLKNHVVAS